MKQKVFNKKVFKNIFPEIFSKKVVKKVKKWSINGLPGISIFPRLVSFPLPQAPCGKTQLPPPELPIASSDWYHLNSGWTL